MNPVSVDIDPCYAQYLAGKMNFFDLIICQMTRIRAGVVSLTASILILVAVTVVVAWLLVLIREYLERKQ